METIKKPARAVNKKALKNKTSEDIKDATILDEDKKDNKDEDTGHKEFFNKAKDTVIPPKEEEPKNVKFSQDIDLDENKDDKNVHKVNFMDENFMEDMLRDKAEQSKDKVEGKEVEEPRIISEKQTQSSGADNSGDNAFTKEDMQDFAEVFMDIIDMGISTALKFYSKDSSTTAYELNVDKKRRLVRQLTNLFMKYQMKFSLEFMFVVTLLICYSVPIAKAKKTRKEIMNGTFKREGGKPGKA